MKPIITLIVGMLLVTPALVCAALVATPRPAQFSLSTLVPANGADGSAGFIASGSAGTNRFGSELGIGDINGDGFEDLVFSDRGTDVPGPVGARRGAVYVIFGPVIDAGIELLAPTLLPENGGDGSRGFVIGGVFDGGELNGAVSGGDINGDGVDDIIVGAFAADVGDRESSGEAYVVFGSTEGFAPVVFLSDLKQANGGDGSSGFVLVAEDAGDRLGGSVGIAGDVNNDGIEDFYVGGSGIKANGIPGAGSVYVIYGRSTAFPAEFLVGDLRGLNGGDGTSGFVLDGWMATSPLAFGPQGNGDINGDGIDDFAIGINRGLNGAGLTSGIVFVLFGRDSGFPSDFDLRELRIANGGDGSDGFVINGIGNTDSTRVGSFAGDVNGDGIEDLTISAELATVNGLFLSGRNYVVYGRNGNFGAELDLEDLLAVNGGDGSLGFVLEGAQERVRLFPVSSAGDLNSDGIDDFVSCGLGANSLGNTDSGECYVHYGSSDGFAPQISVGDLAIENGGDGSSGFRVSGIAAGDSLGLTAHQAIDINDDGADDLILRASISRNGADQGEVYVIYGRPVDDTDEDGLNDVQDNCVLVANPDQRDSNGDGIGNACDADLNDDCIVNATDLGLLRLAFFSVSPDADFDGDGVVNVLDLGILRQQFFSVPGPSALANSCQDVSLQFSSVLPRQHGWGGRRGVDL